MKINSEEIVKDLEDTLDSVLQIASVVLIFIGVFILIITSPIWILPYIIYKKIKYGYI